MQVPPIFSAKKIDGKRAYTLARENKKVELEPKPIFISKLNLTIKQKMKFILSAPVQKELT